MQTVLSADPQTPHILSLPAAAGFSARTRFAPQLPPSAVTALLPQEALSRLESSLGQGDIHEVEIAGPGDPLASIETTLATLRLFAGKYPALSLSLLTLGIGADQHAAALQKAGLGKMRIQVEAVDPALLEKIYLWIRPGKKTLPLPKAAQLLVQEQRLAVLACKEAGLTVHAVTTVYPGLNTEHLAAIAATMAACGADGMTLVPYLPEEGTDFILPAADAATMAEAQKSCSRHLPVTVCDGRLTGDGPHTVATPSLPRPSKERPNVAVASSSGLDVDLHLGQARQLLIYGPREDGLTCLLGTRSAPEPGGPGRRWQKLAAGLTDCYALLAASAGETPRMELAEMGITVLITEDSIEGIVDVLYGGGKKGKQCRK